MTFLAVFLHRLGSSNLPLQRVLKVLPLCNIRVKKEILSMTQTAAPDLYMTAMRLHYRSNFQPLRKVGVSLEDFEDALRIICLSDVDRGIVWTVVKSLPEPHDDNLAFEIEEETLTKELTATQNIFSDTPLYRYSSLRTDLNMPLLHMRSIAKPFLAKVAKLDVIFPCVQRTKNVSRETGQIYCMFDKKRTAQEVRTVDLELLNSREGIMVEGGCEIRRAWRFNELKPRFYYCIGGEAYFASRYVKPVIVVLLECLNPTSKKTRLNLPGSLDIHILDDIMIWDYTAFTSSLSELKYFVQALIENIPEDFEVEVFSYSLGYIHLNLRQLLTDYNNTVNIYHPFSLERIFDRYFSDTGGDGSVPLYHMNSGPLGVPGNIGGSMALHGAVIRSLFKDRKGCSIGDDGIGIDDFVQQHIPAIRHLGNIHPDKFGIISSGNAGVMKFMKRRLERDLEGRVTIDDIIVFPIPCVVDGELAHRTVAFDTEVDRYETVASHVRICLWKAYDHRDALDEDDITTLLNYLHAVYFFMNFPKSGVHQGVPFRSNEVVFSLNGPVPPLDRRCIHTPWEEVMVSDFSKYAVIPMRGRVVLSGPLFAGDVAIACETKFISAMVDLGLMETEPMKEKVTCATVNGRHQISQWYSRKKKDPALLTVTTLVTLPDHFQRCICSQYGRFIHTYL